MASKIIIKLVSILSAIMVLLAFLSFSAFADSTQVPYMKSVYGIWNKFSITFTEGVGQSEETIQNWAYAPNTPTCLTVGFKFDMIPKLTYEVNYHLESDNGQRYNWIGGDRGGPVAAYSEIDLSGVYYSDYSKYEDILLSDKNRIASTTYINSSAAAASYQVDFKTYLKSNSELRDSFKYITFFPVVTAVDPNDASFKITFRGLTIYYNPDDVSEETLITLNEQVAELKALGVKLDVIDESIAKMDKNVTDAIGKVNDTLNYGSDLPAPDKVDKNDINNYGDAEEGLIGGQAGADSDAALDQVLSSDSFSPTNKSAIAFVWDILQQFWDANSKVFGLYFSIMSFGVVALLLGR